MRPSPTLPYRTAWLAAPVLTVLLCVLSSPARAQNAGLEEILSGYSASEAARIEAVILRERWEGFPTDLLVAKADEGAAKGVSADLLLAALLGYAGRLDRAHSLLGGRASVTSLEATADVLEHDIPDDVIRTVAAVNPGDAQLTASMVALGDLLAVGVPPDEAETLLLSAATQRRGNEDVLQIPALVRRWIRQGYQPTAAAAEVRRTMDVPGRPDGMLDRTAPQQPDRPF